MRIKKRYFLNFGGPCPVAPSILVPRTGIKPSVPAVKMQSYHQPAQDVPR